MLKSMEYSIAPEDIKTECEQLGLAVTNICNVKQYRTMLRLSMVFFVVLKPARTTTIYST
jgi:hypothetical protein